MEIISSHAKTQKREEMTLKHRHLFILCSHSSGSTALWRLLQTSPHVSALPQEGQFTGEVAALMRKAPWNEKTELPWATIKAEWDKVWDLDKPILLEKSPPHLLRAQAIEKAFENACFMVMVRNPYAYCEGTRRRGRTGLGYGRDATYAQIAEGWVRETQHQIRNLQVLERVIGLTYEELTNRPVKTTAKVLAFMPELEALNHQATFMIHSLSGWLEQPLTNLNVRQIARLSAADIAEINSVLQYHPAAMAHFGYDFMVKAFSPSFRAQITLSTLFSKYVTRTMQRVARRTMNRGPHLQ